MKGETRTKIAKITRSGAHAITISSFPPPMENSIAAIWDKRKAIPKILRKINSFLLMSYPLISLPYITSPAMSNTNAATIAIIVAAIFFPPPHLKYDML